MLKALQAPVRAVFDRLETLFDLPFGPPWNPIRQLGTLAFFFFWIAGVTGIYVYIVFDTTTDGAWGSVDWMSTEQWYLAGVMRSLHRYSSDGMVVTVMLHFLREFGLDRYRGARWFAWFTGVPVIWLLYVSGISGYWLVWDELAQYVAIGSMEWLDWLNIFGESVANNFLTTESMGDRFFTLLVFMHIFAPLFLLFGMWIHVARVGRPRVNPPRGLALGSLAMFLVLSLAYPAVSHEPANLGEVPQTLNLDWFYMFAYPLYDWLGPGPLWALAFGGSLFLCAMPWLPPGKHPEAPKVFLEKCNGCGRCFEDCPYGAVSMQPRTDGRAFEKEAVVNPDMCTACGICVGSCPLSMPFRSRRGLVTGIDLPELPFAEVHKRITDKIVEARDEASPGNPSILVVGCEFGADTETVSLPALRSVALPCVGMLPPSFIDFALSKDGVEGVMLTGCNDCACQHRLGIQWTEDRMSGLRDPYLRKRVPRERIHTSWAGRTGDQILEAEVQTFRTRLIELAERPPDQKPAGNDADPQPAPAE